MTKSKTISKPHVFYEEVGALIKDARTRAFINQETLATQLSMTRASIINLEKGRHRPSLFLLVEIATILMCDYTSLIPVSLQKKQLVKLDVDFSKSIISDKLTKSEQATVQKMLSAIK